MPPSRLLNNIPVPKRLLALLVSATLSLSAGPAALASAYDSHPKLVVLVVIDQFRADYLQRYRSEFRGRGFRLFLDKGAYFPDCYYGYGNTKTAPGHATLGTGAYSDGHGISANEWWDLARNTKRPITSVEDERYAIVGATAAMATPVAVQQEEANSASAPAAAGAQAPATGQPPAAAQPAPQAPRAPVPAICSPLPWGMSCGSPPRASRACTASRSRIVPRFCRPGQPQMALSGSTLPPGGL
ncbi:alkaline phosphatase family protein [Acidipila sp. EB88]|uniref:alkaline phosphatase family protein n=1 Tax=Acidipila sp. EB88 TaxID=2305226 RepID=UPI001F37AE25|nr:alkaline phosphatase family protein [Acidipila sp. EB88]